MIKTIWIPAFAGMTDQIWIPAFVGMTINLKVRGKIE